MDSLMILLGIAVFALYLGSRGIRVGGSSDDKKMD